MRNASISSFLSPFSFIPMSQPSMTTEDINLTGWIVGAIGTAFGTLSATVATLFKLNESKNAKAIQALEQRLASESADLKAEITRANERAEVSDQKHDDCLRDREELRVEMAMLKGSVEALKQNKGQA